MTNLIDERDRRTRERKKKKKEMDELIGLSSKQPISMSASAGTIESNTARLLDEGYFDEGFVIKKGAMEKYLNGKNEKVRGWRLVDGQYEQTEVLNLTDDFVGTVNLGHMDFSIFPFELGSWTKRDLSLEDMENDRKAIYVDTNGIDEESMYVKELRRQAEERGIKIGVSAEFWTHVNEEDTEKLSEMLGEYTPVYDEIFIEAYGLVGECGNVNSSEIELKGGVMSDMKKELLEEETVEETVEEEEIVEEEKTEEIEGERRN